MEPDAPTEPYEEDVEVKCECCGEMSDDVVDGLCEDCREALEEDEGKASAE